MPLFRFFYIIVLLALSTTAVAYAAGERDVIIQQQMDCTDGHLKQGTAISWDDVCDIPESSYQQHIQIVNQQMDQVQGGIAPQELPKKHPWAFEIASEVSSIRYHEPTFMKETGSMYGLNAIVTYHPPKGNALNSEITDVYRLEARFSYGKVNYRGGIENSDGSVTPEGFNGISDYMFEIRDIAGKEFYFNNQSTRLTPYLGAGYRSLYDDLYVNKPFGYDRRIQYLYVPIGAEVMRKLGDGWSIGADAEYDIFIRGFVTSYLETIGLGKLTNTQSSGYGLRGSVKLVKNCDRFNFIIEPYVRYWHIQNSRVDSSTPFSFEGHEYFIDGIEPNNNSLEIGSRFGIEF